MKKLIVLTLFVSMMLGILASSFNIAGMVSAAEADNNLIANPSLEESANNLPTNWYEDSYGKNKPVFKYNNFGHTGSRSAGLTVTNYKRGDAKWYPLEMSVSPNTKYTFGDWYQGSATSHIDVVIKTTSNKTIYKYLGKAAVSSDWKQVTFSFITPADVKTITFYHYLRSNGTLNTDDYSLTTTAPPSAAPPTVNLSADPTVIGYETNNSSATLNWSTSGATAVSFSPSIGSTALSGTKSVSPTATTTYTLTAVGDGGTTTKSITITVNIAPPPQVIEKPTISFSANPTTIGSGTNTTNSTLTWTTANATAVSFSPSIGSTALSGTKSVSPTATTTYILTAVGDGGTSISTVTVTVNSEVPTATNLIKNASVEESSSFLPLYWSYNSWGVLSPTFENLAEGRTGQYSLKTTLTSYTSGDAKWYYDPVAVTPGKTYRYSNWYKSNVDTEVDVMVKFADGSIGYYYLAIALASPTDWEKVSGEFTMPQNAVSATAFQIIDKVGYVQSDDFTFTEYTPQKLNRALVSINFDDGWRSAYQYALPLLQKYGFVSTQYILTSTFDYPDYMDTAMIQAFKDQGGEIASHGVSHPHLTTLNSAGLINELAGSQASLRNIFGTMEVANNFATPYGEYNSTVLNEIKKYYRSHRSTDTGFNNKDNFDIYNIKVQNIYSTTTLAEVQSWVDEASTNNSWLVLVYHQVNASSGGLYSITSANLDAHLGAIKTSGIAVKTVNQALDEITAQLQ